MAGRRPKSEEQKILEGRPGKRPPKNVIKPTGFAKRPTYLDKEARREWNRICEDMKLLGMLTAIDQTIFAGYCQLHSVALKTGRVVSEKGTTYEANGLVKVRPEWKIFKEAVAELRKFAVEYGLTPASRTKVTPASPQLGLPGIPDAPKLPAGSDAADPDDVTRFFGAGPGTAH